MITSYLQECYVTAVNFQWSYQHFNRIYQFFLDEVTSVCLFVSDILENNVAVVMSNISFLLCLIFAVVVFITGYLVRMVTRHVCCPLCLSALICSKEEAEKMLLFVLQNCKRWGNFINSSFFNPTRHFTL